MSGNCACLCPRPPDASWARWFGGLVEEPDDLIGMVTEQRIHSTSRIFASRSITTYPVSARKDERRGCLTETDRSGARDVGDVIDDDHDDGDDEASGNEGQRPPSAS